MTRNKRLYESGLIKIVINILLLGLLIVYLAANSFTYTSQHSLSFFVYGFIISFLFYFIHKVMTLIDDAPQNQVIFPSICFLSSIGLIFQYRLSPNGLAVIQARWLIVGLLSFLLTILVFRRHYRKLEQYKYSIGVFAIILLLITIWQIIHLPSDVTVAPRIRIYKDFGFQASELVKLCYVIFLAGYMAEYHGYFLFAQYKKIGVINFLRFFRATIIISLILASLFVVDKRCRDIGPLPVLFGALLTINYAANKKWTHLLIGLTVFIGIAILSGFLFEHVKDRVLAWWNPEFDASGKGFVTIHSLLALKTGGFLGVSLTQGAAASIPEVAEDLIIIPIIEELGFIGTASILMVFLLLAVNGIKIAIASKDDFSRFLAVGIVALITFQTFIVIGGAIGLIPLTGMVLSYVAYGGTATVAFYQMAALLLCASSGG